MSTVIVMVVLLLIFMSNQFAETLGEAASDLLPRDAVLSVFRLQFVQYVSLLAPVGLMIGVLLALARLNRDSEMAALLASGVGPAALLKPVGLMSLLVASGITWLALVKAPEASRIIEEIRAQAQDEMELGVLTPGRFSSVDGGETIVYVTEVDELTGDLLGVFIERRGEGGTDVVVAERGNAVTNGETGEIQLELRNGKRYVGTPGQNEFYFEEFEGIGIPIRTTMTEFVETIESRSTSSLLQSMDPESRAEFEWRISAPISILLLALLAVPLGKSSPREGRYARLGVGLLIFIIYENSLSIARVWLERETTPQWLGIWWVHAALALFAILMLMSQSGVGVKAPLIPKVRHEPLG